jgi:D-alanyl-lipoteichoic acid acyltransferase DltB (MBOAT superfamily)
MIVPSGEFLAFALAAALIINLSSAVWWRQAVLLWVNIGFLASFTTQPAAIIPFAGFLALGYVAQSVTGGGQAHRLFVVLVLVTLTAFFWLKRYTFIPSAVWLPFPYVTVGLSYVFFRVLHVIIDRHQGEIEERVGVVSWLNYTLNFTSLTSGPIQNYQDYRRAERDPPGLDPMVIGRAVERIIIGYFKVAVVSMLLAMAQHAATVELTAGEPMARRIWCGTRIAMIYPVYLYFNFSGYMDVVIGLARCCGIVLPENFDRPFSSENFIVFWSRWHITLSNWLRAYVFNPLTMAGMRRVRSRGLGPYVGVAAYFITFFLVGLWHGQTTEFVFFGFLQGGGVAVNRLYQVVMQRRLGDAAWRMLSANPVYAACARGLTFTWFSFSLLWFWSDWARLRGFAADLGPTALSLVWLATFVAATLILSALQGVWDAVPRVTWRQIPISRSRYVRTAWGTALAVVTVAVIVVLRSPAPDIVYQAF